MIDFATARQRLEAKDRSPRDKRMSAQEAAELVQDNQTVAIGGCLYSRTPMAVLRQVIRRRPRGLTLVRNLSCYETELFMVAGSADQLMTSWMGIGLPWGISPILRSYVESGRLRYQEWSHLALGLRLRAAAMGISFLPSTSMLGSDLMRTSGAKTMICPYTGHPLCLVPALFPDVAIVHVHRADIYGNAQIDGYPHMDVDMAGAATTVILSTEEIVDTEEIRRTASSTAIPFFAVDAVVEARFGSFPHECFGLYDADMEHIGSYAESVRARGAEAVLAYLDRFVFEPTSHQEYLDRVGLDRLEACRRRVPELMS